MRLLVEFGTFLCVLCVSVFQTFDFFAAREDFLFLNLQVVRWSHVAQSKRGFPIPHPCPGSDIRVSPIQLDE